ncbi:MAG: enoyl-CoA hydratase/isomerase family protein [bacterium]
MNYENIIFKVEQNIAHLTLNRPDQLNALNESIIQEMQNALKESSSRDDVRVVVISGAGKAFSAGGDIKVMKQALESGEPAKFFIEPLRGLNQIAMTIRNLPKPVMAAIHGFANGAGLNLALCCDIRIAALSTKFNQAFIKIGLVPDTGGTYLLPRIIGMAKATELFFTGDFIEAKEAERLGIINKAVPDDKLQEETLKYATKLTQVPTYAIGKIKMLLQMSYQLNFDSQVELERTAQIEIAEKSQDFIEGVSAFLEKREPKFIGK